MTDNPSPPAPPPPEIVDQALALLVKAMEQGQPGDETDDGESGVPHLDRLAWRHQVAGNALQMAAQKRAALLRRQRNALIPIDQLPSELLSAILVESYNDELSLDRLQELVQVAWKWWQTIKSDSQFWTLIRYPMKVAELMIRKAGTLPLLLHWADWGNSTDDEDDTDDEHSTVWDALRDLVPRHATRWTSIELERFGGEEACLEALCTNHFPHLEYLRVYMSRNPDMMTKDWRLNLAQCQNLQVARLPLMPYLPVTPSSSSPIPLRTLHLNLRYMDSCSSYDLESLLQLTPQLVELNVKYLISDTNPPAPFDAPIIDLPNLQSLEFTHAATGDERECIPLLAQIRAPQLERLGLYYEPDSDRDDDLILSHVTGRAVFTALATWPSASTNRPEDALLHSLLRNAGPSAAWRVNISEAGATVGAKGSGSGRLDIRLGDQYILDNQHPEDILTRLAPFGLPVYLYVVLRDSRPGTVGLEFWDRVLDATPSLRAFRVGNTVETCHQVANSLSTKAPSSSSAGPRAPHLEELSFEGISLQELFEDEEDGAVKTMLDKRREIFIQGGVSDPPKLVVTGNKGEWY